MFEEISFQEALQIHKEWVTHFQSLGDSSGCQKNDSYAMPLKGPTDVKEGELVDSIIIGNVAITSNDSQNPCQDNQVVITNDLVPDGYECWNDIKYFCTPTPSNSLNHSLVSSNHSDKLKSLVLDFQSSLATIGQNNPLKDLNIIVCSAFNLGISVLLLGLTGSYPFPSENSSIILASGSGGSNQVSYQAQ